MTPPVRPVRPWKVLPRTDMSGPDHTNTPGILLAVADEGISFGKVVVAVAQGQVRADSKKTLSRMMFLQVLLEMISVSPSQRSKRFDSTTQ